MVQASTVKRTAVTANVSKIKAQTPSEKTTKTNADFCKKVAEKAYELYVARGCANGHDVEDWVKAEKIVKGS